MEKRALLAVVLSVAVFYLFSVLTGQQKPKPLVSDQVQKPVTSQSLSVTASQPKPVMPVVDTTKDVSVQDVKVVTPLYTAVFSTSGASLKSLTLNNYREANSSKSPLVVLAANSDPSVLSFSTKGTGFSLNPSSVYSASSSSLVLSKGESRSLIFTHLSSSGFVVRKVFTFTGNDYGIKLDSHVLNNGSSQLSGSLQHQLSSPFEFKEKDSRYENYGSTVYADNGLHTASPKDIASGRRYDKSIQWAGITDKYFLTALISDKSAPASVELKKLPSNFIELTWSSSSFALAPGQSFQQSNRIFVGPKDIDILKSQGVMLEQSLDLGWFTFLAKPMLHSLKFFYGYVGNYGVAIIIITVILKILFFPLTHKSYKSMKEMSNLQPKMLALKEKYKNDRDAMNRAVMELYREHKVNPLGGCLPMLVQIPVFFALYKALMFSIELRHAPFMLWVTDLSDKDPYYVTPIVMGVTMFIQQKLTPSNMDELQQKVMLALPVVFTFMFLTFPSGLVLYWLVNNILTIGQQLYINKLMKD